MRRTPHDGPRRPGAAQWVRVLVAVSVLIPVMAVTPSFVPGLGDDPVVEAALGGREYMAITAVKAVATATSDLPTGSCPPGKNADTNGLGRELGWFIHPKDLNNGAGGDYVYLCYQIGDADDAITTITVYEDACPSGWTTGGANLNEKAGGSKLYLCSLKGGDDPLLALSVVSSPFGPVSCPETGYSRRVYYDLNDDAGGDYIYLCKLHVSDVDSWTACGGYQERSCDGFDRGSPECDVGLDATGGYCNENDGRFDGGSTYDSIVGFRSTWTYWALRNQHNEIGLRSPIQQVTHLEAHNSYANRADGFFRTFNQTYSITDQLRSGARVVELDVHNEDMSSDVDVDLEPLEVLHRNGASPPSAIAGFDRYFHGALKEIRDWMLLTENREEIVFVNLESYIGKWNAPMLTYLLSKYFGDARIGLYQWADYSSDGSSLPSRAELLERGTRVIVTNGPSNPEPEGTDSTKTDRNVVYFGNYYAGNVDIDDAVDDGLMSGSCSIFGGDAPSATPKKLHRSYSNLTEQTTAEQVRRLVQCGVTDVALDDLLCPDFLDCDYTDDIARLNGLIWSWEENHWPQAGRAAVVKPSGRWISASPTESRRHLCRTDSSWVLTATADGFVDGWAACAALGHEFGTPRNIWENQAVAPLVTGVADGVWTSFHNTDSLGWRELRAPEITLTRTSGIEGGVEIRFDSDVDTAVERADVVPDCGNGTLTETEAEPDVDGSWSGVFRCKFGVGVTATGISMTMTDANGLVGTTVVDDFITVNAPPVIYVFERYQLTTSSDGTTVPEPKPLEVGQPRSVTIAIRDYDADDHTWTVDWGDGTTSNGTFMRGTDNYYDEVTGGRYTNGGDYTVTVEVCDGTDCDQRATTIHVDDRVGATPPYVSLHRSDPTNPLVAIEGSTATFAWLITDAKDFAELEATVTWGDGSSDSFDVADMTPTTRPLNGVPTTHYEYSHTYATPGDYTMTMTVRDPFENLTDSDTATIQVRTRTPEITSITIDPLDVASGGTITVDVEATDFGARGGLEAVAYLNRVEVARVDMTETYDATTRTTTGTASMSIDVGTIANYYVPFEVVIVDPVSPTSRDPEQKHFVWLNKSAVTGSFINDAWADENVPEAFDIVIASRAGASYAYVTWGDGRTDLLTLPDWDPGCECQRVSLTHTFVAGSGVRPDSDSATLYFPSVWADLGTGDQQVASSEVRVWETGPTVEVDPVGQAFVDEPLTVSGSVIDGADDTHTVFVYRPDLDQTLTATYDATTKRFSLPMRFTEPGRVPVEVWAWAEDSLQRRRSDIVTVDVTAVSRPTVTVDDVVGIEGVPVGIEVRIPRLPLSGDVTALAIDWGDGSTDSIATGLPAPSYDPVCDCMQLLVEHVYPDGKGIDADTARVYDIEVWLTDVYGSDAAATAEARMVNAAPTIDVVDPPSLVLVGQEFTLSGSMFDVPGDGALVAVNWEADTCADCWIGVPTDATTGQFGATFAYDTAGPRRVRFQAYDEDFGDTGLDVELFVVEPNGEVPSVVVRPATGQPAPTNSAPVRFEVTFSEPVTGFDVGDLAVTSPTGATVTGITGGPVEYEVELGGMVTDGLIDVTVMPRSVSDAEGSTNAIGGSASVEFDATAPTPTVDLAAGQPGTVTATPVGFEIVFPEPVTGFGHDDVVVGGTAGATAVEVAGGPIRYRATVTTVPRTGTVSISVPAGAAIDLAGNPSTAASVVADLVEIVDETAPVLEVSGVVAGVLEVTAAPGTTGTTVSFFVEATDPDSAGGLTEGVIGGDVAVTCDPASGSFFPIGDTAVRCTATDANGNIGETTFVVRVESTGPTSTTTPTTSPTTTSPSTPTTPTTTPTTPTTPPTFEPSGELPATGGEPGSLGVAPWLVAFGLVFWLVSRRRRPSRAP